MARSRASAIDNTERSPGTVSSFRLSSRTGWLEFAALTFYVEKQVKRYFRLPQPWRHAGRCLTVHRLRDPCDAPSRCERDRDGHDCFDSPDTPRDIAVSSHTLVTRDKMDPGRFGSRHDNTFRLRAHAPTPHAASPKAPAASLSSLAVSRGCQSFVVALTLQLVIATKRSGCGHAFAEHDVRSRNLRRRGEPAFRPTSGGNRFDDAHR